MMTPVDLASETLRTYDSNLALLAEAAGEIGNPDLAMYFRALLAMNEAAIGSGIEEYIHAALFASWMTYLQVTCRYEEYAAAVDRIGSIPALYTGEEV